MPRHRIGLFAFICGLLAVWTAIPAGADEPVGSGNGKTGSGGGVVAETGPSDLAIIMAMERLLKHEDVGIRRSAVRYLALLDDPRAAKVLRRRWGIKTPLFASPLPTRCAAEECSRPKRLRRCAKCATCRR